MLAGAGGRLQGTEGDPVRQVDEIAACPPIREALRAGDRVLHYRNAPLRVIPQAIPAAFFERHWEMLTQEGLAGLLVVRNWQCV